MRNTSTCKKYNLAETEGDTGHDTALQDHESEGDKQVLRRSPRTTQRTSYLADYDFT